MKCKFCGAELMPSTNFCVQCGENNDEKIVEIKSGESSESLETENVSSSNEKKKSLNLIIIFIPVLIIIIITIFFIVAIIVPCVPKASLESGKYDECKKISFSASSILPFGENPEIYISVDGNEFDIYDGKEYHLNQVKTYSYDVYTINGAGIKSSEIHYEYDMNVPKPHELKASVKPGIYEDYQDVEILTDDGSTIYFTLDGSDPTESSRVYDTAIHLDNGITTIKALAINSDGTIGDVYQWQYEVKLPIPSDVAFSVDEGIYYTAFDLELKSDADATIYYTIDGSEPTIQSTMYSEPLRLENGIYTVKSMAVNEYNMSSEITSSKYVITMQKYARFPKSTVADKYYGSIGDAGVLVGFDSQLNEVKRYGIDGVTAVYSDGMSIYYLAYNTLYKLEEDSDVGNKLVDMYVDNFALVKGDLYIESSNILYSMDINGGNLSKYKGMDSCSIMGCWNDELYCSKEGTIFKITSNESKPKEITDVESSRVFIRENKIYYIDEEQGLSCKNLKDGSNTKLINTDSNYYNLDAEFELFNTTDKSEIITTSCIDLYACNNTLYVLERIDDECRTYHLITDKTDVSSSTSYRWYAVNLETNGISDTNIVTSNITVFDNAIIDGNENRNQVIQ